MEVKKHERKLIRMLVKYYGLSQPCGIILARKEFFDKTFEKSERATGMEYLT